MEPKQSKPKPMTLDQFFALLPKRGWKLEGAVIRRTVDDRPYCPIAVVANRVCKGRKYFTGSWKVAAHDLGLPMSLAHRIVHAADFKSRTVIRRRLLEHCGLKEAA